MCYFAKKRPTVRVADDDIPVYKILMITHDGRIVTPFALEEMPGDGILKQPKRVVSQFTSGHGSIGKPELITDYVYPDGYKFRVHIGFHSYTDIEQARCMRAKLDGVTINVWNGNHIILPAVIPKGSSYIEGDSDYGDAVSDRLTVDMKAERL